MTFLRTAVNSQRKARGEDEISATDFLKQVRERAKSLQIDAEMLKRPVNVGFSGGEKKRNEILEHGLKESRDQTISLKHLANKSKRKDIEINKAASF